MARRSLTCVPDHKLLHLLADLVSQDRTTTAEMLEHIAEVDARKLYLPAGYSSMYRYCVFQLKMSEDMAYKRLRSARKAREFPAILDMIQDGRLHLAAVVCAAPHLTPANAADLLAASANKTRAQLEQLLAERFPQSDVQTQVRPIPASSSEASTVPAQPHESAGVLALATPGSKPLELAPGPVVPIDDARVATPVVPLSPRSRVAPIAPERFALQVTLTKSTHDKLRRAQELLSHALPSGEIAQVLDRALDELISKLEKRRFATTQRPGKPRRSKSARHVPAHVRRAVSERDRYQCTFVSESGRRCTERRFLEYDHVHPVARGGEATIENTRLRCRAHNQYEAERIYGAGFMREQRERARGARGRDEPVARPPA